MQVFWPLPKGRLQKGCRLGMRLAWRPLQPAQAGGPLRQPGEGVPHSPPEPATEPTDMLLAPPPCLAQCLWIWWNTTGSSLSEKKNPKPNRFAAQRPPSEGGLLLLVGTQIDAGWTQGYVAACQLLREGSAGRKEPASPSSLEEIKALLRPFPPCFWRKGKSKEWTRKRERKQKGKKKKRPGLSFHTRSNQGVHKRESQKIPGPRCQIQGKESSWFPKQRWPLLGFSAKNSSHPYSSFWLCS